MHAQLITCLMNAKNKLHMDSRITRLTLVFLCTLFLSGITYAQDKEWSRSRDNFYVSSGGEMIFSWANTSHPTSTDGTVLRWSPVFNFQSFLNYDFGNAFGIMGGLAIRNVGYIYHFNDVNEVEFRKKFRTYNLGIPVGIKIGNMNGWHIYGGYEFELPFHYKEKTFDEDNSKLNGQTITSWFSDRHQSTMHALYAGIQMKEGMNLKFKYYLTEFHNQGFTTTTGNEYAPSGDPNQPYRGLESNVFYIAITWNLSKKNYHYYKPPKRKDFR